MAKFVMTVVQKLMMNYKKVLFTLDSFCYFMYEDKFRIARTIQKENSDIEAPINDIVDCITDVQKSGIKDEDKIRKFVKNSFRSDTDNGFHNEERNPVENEILLYTISDELATIIEKPE